MTPEQYRKVGEIFHAALDVPESERRLFVEGACGSDHALLDEVLSLLAAQAEAGDFIESPPDEVEARLDESLPPPRVPPLSGGDDPTEKGMLMPGESLGRYRVLDLLGAGGMGRVYRAVDPGLNREVAIKALAQTFRDDSTSLRRFEREARILATLSHPNIATIFGFEQIDGAPYLILERVEGETLADRLANGPLTVDESVRIALQIVAGLEDAHAKGVVHRDLKPSNVMLTPDGRVKLVDFGLAKSAKARDQEIESAAPITRQGVVLGTARYMSPEQIRGDEIDTRADVWAFGCVLFEMLTGEAAFPGRTVSEVVAAVLRDEPAWHRLPARTSRNVRRLLRRCLRRELPARLQHIADARLELTEPDEAPEEVASAAQVRRWRLAAFGTAVAAVLVALVAFGRPQTVKAPAPAQLSLELPGGLRLGNEWSAPFAIAPGGSPLVLEVEEGGTTRLYSRDLLETELRPLQGTDGARQAFFSPDGKWVGFFADRKLLKVPVDGGPQAQLADIGGNPRGATWAPDGTIVVAPTQTSGLVRLPDTGGRLVPLTTLDKERGESSHRWPVMVPGGEWVLFSVGFEDSSYDDARIDAVSLATGERRQVINGAGYARFAAVDRLLFVRAGRIYSVGFDLESVAPQGTPQAVFDPIRYDLRNGGTHLTAALNGTTIYTPGVPTSSDYFISWADRQGRLTRATDTPRGFREAVPAPDGRRIASVVGPGDDSDLWVVDAGSTLSRLTFNLSPHRPVWMPRGDRITVGVEQERTWRLVNVGSTGQASDVLFETPHRLYPTSWSRDGRFLMFQESRPDTGWDLRVLEVDAQGRPSGPPRSFAETPANEAVASFSPDGRWVAYESDELDGVVQIYVRSFPDGGGKVRISSEGARSPQWDASGRLYFWQTGDDTLQMVQPRASGEGLTFDPPQPVWDAAVRPELMKRIVMRVGGGRYGVESTGTRFAVLESNMVGAAPRLSQPVIVMGAR